MADVVVDASVVVDLVLRSPRTASAEARLGAESWHAPAHLDAEILSALGRLHRAGLLTRRHVADVLDDVADLAVERHGLAALLAGAWKRSGSLRTTDALYVELAARLGTVVVTTDARLARATPLAELVGPPTLET